MKSSLSKLKVKIVIKNKMLINQRLNLRMLINFESLKNKTPVKIKWK
jgi:hypothetical protein